MSSVHLAEELRSGLSAADLVARAGVLAVANDLLPATAAVLPGLVPFRRALTRLPRAADRAVRLRADPLGALSFARRTQRPRPTWSGRACATGRSTAPGDADPFVGRDDASSRTPAEEEPPT